MFYLLITDNGYWSRGDTPVEVFVNLLQQNSTRVPSEAILYEYEADDPLKVWVSELGWIMKAEDALIVSEKFFKPAEIFKAYASFEGLIEEVVYQ